MSGPRIVFCSNNHIYDASLYDACPYCSKIAAEQKELVSSTAGVDPAIMHPVGMDETIGPDSFSGDFSAPPGFGPAAEPVDFSGPDFGTDDPYAATVVGTGSFEPFDRTSERSGGTSEPYDKTSERGAGTSEPYDKTSERGAGTFEPEKSIAGTGPEPFAAFEGFPGTDSAIEKDLSGTGSSDNNMSAGIPEDSAFPGSADGIADYGTAADSGDADFPEDEIEPDPSDEEDIPGIKIPFFTKDGVPDPRNLDTSVGRTEEVGAGTSKSQKEAEKAEEAPASKEAEAPAEEGISQAGSFGEIPEGDAGYGEEFYEEDGWDEPLLKNEGPVRGWFILQNGPQQDHSVELCKKSMFIYDYDGMCLVLSGQMENMTLLATIEQYKAISILPEPGVPFEVNGEPRRSCGRLGAYMRLLVGSHRMVFVPVDERLLNGEG